MSRKFLTYLDKQNTNADNLPLELFDDFVNENLKIKKIIEERKEKGKPPLEAQSYYFHLDGRREETESKVLDYDPDKKKFLIEFKSQG